MWETDTTVVIYSWRHRAMMSCASHLISHSTYWCSIANKELRLCCCIQWYPQVTNISKLYLMPNFSMIEKVVQQECAIDYLVSKYTFLLINQFIQRQIFLIYEDILWRFIFTYNVQYKLRFPLLLTIKVCSSSTLFWFINKEDKLNFKIWNFMFFSCYYSCIIGRM